MNERTGREQVASGRFLFLSSLAGTSPGDSSRRNLRTNYQSTGNALKRRFQNPREMELNETRNNANQPIPVCRRACGTSVREERYPRRSGPVLPRIRKMNTCALLLSGPDLFRQGRCRRCGTMSQGSLDKGHACIAGGWITGNTRKRHPGWMPDD